MYIVQHLYNTLSYIVIFTMQYEYNKLSYMRGSCTSILKRTPPIGAAKVQLTPTAQAAANISTFLVSFENILLKP